MQRGTGYVDGLQKFNGENLRDIMWVVFDKFVCAEQFPLVVGQHGEDVLVDFVDSLVGGC